MAPEQVLWITDMEMIPGAEAEDHRASTGAGKTGQTFAQAGQGVSDASPDQGLIVAIVHEKPNGWLRENPDDKPFLAYFLRKLYHNNRALLSGKLVLIYFFRRNSRCCSPGINLQSTRTDLTFNPSR